ncbi:hypothetical protein Ddye_005661 [Dipteronia dyeriana]|uniref:Transcription factor MYC/MYB N-terminal domain-containing protein n=1 Tax=Dipteronia dyeriana TaxID=168575 RepID=A0AAE0CQG6_9ROSI|nr:hypothetical protein Ddye_005661 [Dipteronia dyeriana]
MVVVDLLEPAKARGVAVIVGPAAFTGNHKWILANNHITAAHPLETVAVIPILPHGVVQLGSNVAVEWFSETTLTLITTSKWFPTTLKLFLTGSCS